MSKVVYAKTSGVIAHGGNRVRVNAGEPWDGNDALVKEHPDMFVDHVNAVRSTTDPRGYREYAPDVERATRAPGEKRATRRVKTTESPAEPATDE